MRMLEAVWWCQIAIHVSDRPGHLVLSVGLMAWQCVRKMGSGRQLVSRWLPICHVLLDCRDEPRDLVCWEDGDERTTNSVLRKVRTNGWLGKEKEFLTGNADPTQCVCEQYTFTAGCGAIDGPEVQRSSTVSFSSLSVNFGRLIGGAVENQHCLTYNFIQDHSQCLIDGPNIVVITCPEIEDDLPIAE